MSVALSLLHFIVCITMLGAQATIQLPDAHDGVLRRWLDTRKDLRLVRLDDCEDRWIDSARKEHVQSCEQLVQALREWTNDPKTQPFYVTGDFNGDGHEDFSVVLTDVGEGKPSAQLTTVVVFNGPFQAATAVEPAFSVATKQPASKTFLAYGPPRPKPWRLIIGPPETEGRALVWRDGRYVLSPTPPKR